MNRKKEADLRTKYSSVKCLLKTLERMVTWIENMARLGTVSTEENMEVSTEENMELREELVCSQEERPHNRVAPRKIAEQTAVS